MKSIKRTHSFQKKRGQRNLKKKEDLK